MKSYIRCFAAIFTSRWYPIGFRGVCVIIAAALFLLSESILPVREASGSQSQSNESNVQTAAAGSQQAGEQAHEPPRANGKKRRAQVSWSSLASQYPGAFATKGPSLPRRAALTFDDVPDGEFTPQVLDVLAREHVRATFFIVGHRAAERPEMVRRIRREGHAIGSHSYDHSSFAKLSVAQFAGQVTTTDRILFSQLGFTPRFIRPPYGEIRPEQLEWAGKRGYYVVNWNVDTEDWKGLSANAIIRNVKRTLTPGSIILQHAGGGVGEDLSGTVEALPRIIRMLKEKGYRLVTIPELLNESEWIEPYRD